MKSLIGKKATKANAAAWLMEHFNAGKSLTLPPVGSDAYLAVARAYRDVYFELLQNANESNKLRWTMFALRNKLDFKAGQATDERDAG